MRFYIDNVSVLSAIERNCPIKQVHRFDKAQIPKLDWVPAMQRRRLSMFTQMALHCAYQASDGQKGLPVVFASRHGDLHKTAGLLDSLANNDSLSPTAFSMSVHNASAGLLSILTGNQSASNTISAGKDTFVSGLIDAYIRLDDSSNDKILFVHCDQALPEEYLSFQDEKQIDHCIAFTLSKTRRSEVFLSIEQLASQSTADMADKKTSPQGIAFIDFIKDCLPTLELEGKRNNWYVKRL
ncbi:beta-ketoacyl synthase chain length factor [Thalassotalea ganghwensis]